MDLLVGILRGGYLMVGRFHLMVDVLLVSVVVGSSVVVCVSVMGIVCAMMSVMSIRGAVAGGMDILDTVMGWVVDEVMSVMKTMAKMMRSVDSVVTSEVVCCVEAVFVGVVVCFSAVCSVVGGGGTMSMGSGVLVSGSVNVIRGLVDSGVAGTLLSVLLVVVLLGSMVVVVSGLSAMSLAVSVLVCKVSSMRIMAELLVTRGGGSGMVELRGMVAAMDEAPMMREGGCCE